MPSYRKVGQTDHYRKVGQTDHYQKDDGDGPNWVAVIIIVIVLLVLFGSC